MGGYTPAGLALLDIRKAYESANAALEMDESAKRESALKEVLPKLLAAQESAEESAKYEDGLYDEIDRLEKEVARLKARLEQRDEPDNSNAAR